MSKQQIRNATLHQGDCLDIILKLEDDSVDIVITDPPYCSGGLSTCERQKSPVTKYVTSSTVSKYSEFSGDTKDQRSFMKWSQWWMGSAYPKLRPGGILAVFSDWRQIPAVSDSLQFSDYTWRGIATWVKVNARPQKGRFSSQCEYILWGTKGSRKTQGRCVRGAITAHSPAKRLHVTEKPLDVCRWLLEITNEGDTVLDPFMG